MTLLDRLHEEYEAGGRLVLFRCTECGQTDMSLGSLHAHIEGHRGYTRLGIQIPLTKTSPANGDELMKRTEVLRVDETSEISLAEVNGL
jgi:hypothetical protein